MKNILLIVEGAVTEKNFFTKLSSLYTDKTDNLHIFPFKTNIYQLYQNIKDYGTDFTDTIDVLKKTCKTNTDYSILNNKFAYIYLIFDFEYQDPQFSEIKVNELIDMFNDESEKGLLYINYPMFESYKDHNNYILNDYFIRTVDINLVNGKYYKSLVSKRGYKKNINDYIIKDFDNCLYINGIKANKLIYNSEIIIPYSLYRKENISKEISKKCFQIIKNENKILF